MRDSYKEQAAPTLILALLTSCLAVSSQAAEYSLDYKVEGGYEYDDNVGLRPNDKVDISGGTLSLPATLTMRTERTESSLMGEVTSAKFDESDWNSDDQNLQANTAYQLERGELAGHAGYKRDSTRTSEFLDTGVVGLSATRREEATVGGLGEYMFTEKNGISSGIDYSDVNYDSRRYSDYDYLAGNIGWLHQWSEVTVLRLQGIASRYENSANLEITSDSMGAQVGFDSRLSERLKVTLLAGWVNIDTDYSTSSSIPSPDDDSNDVFQMNGSLNYREERYELIAKIRSGTRPSGRGNLDKTDQLDLTYRYHVSERSRFDLGLIGGKNSSLESRINNDRDYARARLRLDYRISQSWYVAGTYTYSYQDRQRDDDHADSNQVEVSLIFQPEKHVWSR